MNTWILLYILTGTLMSGMMLARYKPEPGKHFSLIAHVFAILLISLIWPVPVIATFYSMYLERKEVK